MITKHLEYILNQFLDFIPPSVQKYFFSLTDNRMESEKLTQVMF